jgi:hypothetical protein
MLIQDGGETVRNRKMHAIAERLAGFQGEICLQGPGIAVGGWRVAV